MKFNSPIRIFNLLIKKIFEMFYLLSALIGLIIGSFPSAYLVAKYGHNLNISEHGSGNVGAMNTYEVTNSKVSGIIVFLLDALKGALSVFIVLAFIENSFLLAGIALVMAVLSHCYNFWLNFKGGRGLATAFGGAVIIFPLIPVLWIVYWVLFYLIKREIIIANFMASIFALGSILALTNYALQYTFPKADSYSSFIFFSIALMSIIFSKHIEPIQNILETINRK